MAAASEKREEFSGGVGGRVCVAEAASWQVCKRAGGGTKQEDEVIAKVRGGEERRGGCGWSLGEWHLFQRWAQPRRLELLPLSPLLLPSAGSAAASVFLWQRGIRLPQWNELKQRGETPASADMVGDLFLWSFCCLRLWKRDKKVSFSAARHCWRRWIIDAEPV